MKGTSKIRVAFFLPHLSTGGLERIIVNLLLHLDRRRFAPSMILQELSGDMLDALPADVPVYDLGGARALFGTRELARCLTTNRIDVVYTGTNATSLSAITAAMAMRPSPAVIVGEHTPLSYYWASAKWQSFRKLVTKLLFPRARGIVVPIVDIADEFKAFIGNGCPPVHVLTNPILEASDVVDAASLTDSVPADGIHLVAAGRLTTVKGFDILLQAMHRLPQTLPECRLTILGDGPERAALEAQIAQLGLEACVTLAGRVSNPLDYYRQAFALVVSSRFESGPNVLVEAMAVGTPTISANCPFGPRRILLDGEAGLLVPPEDPDAIAEAILKLAGDSALYRGLRERGLRRARDFTTESALPPYEALFEQAARQPAER